MNRFLHAKANLAQREMAVQAQLKADTLAVLAGETPSQEETWSLAGAYDRLLEGMAIDGTELVDFAEAMVEELVEYKDPGNPGRGPAAATIVRASGEELRGWALQIASVVSMYWYLQGRS